MKKNEKKWAIIAIILAMMIIAGRIMNDRASAKEVEDEPARSAYSYHWLDDDDTLPEALSAIAEDLEAKNGDFELYSVSWDSENSRYEIDYKSGKWIGTMYIHK